MWNWFMNRKKKPSWLYFAYGSNMNQGRLESRVGPVEKIGTASLYGHKLLFNAVGNTKQAYANIKKQDRGMVKGVVYALTRQQIKLLDTFEVLYKREKKYVFKDGDNEMLECYTYVDNYSNINPAIGLPRKEYLQHVLIGAYLNRFDKNYIRMLQKIKTQ